MWFTPPWNAYTGTAENPPKEIIIEEILDLKHIYLLPFNYKPSISPSLPHIMVGRILSIL